MRGRPSNLRWLALEHLPLLWLVLVMALFTALTRDFLTLENLTTIVVRSAAPALVAVGMTFVLLTAGIDLSVGSVIFLGAALCGKLIHLDCPVVLAVAACLAVGPMCGLVHVLFIAGLRMAPFIVTLATLFLLRGLGLWISQTRALHLPDELRQLATTRWLGIPTPVLVLAGVVLLLHGLQEKTAFGRQVLAVGNDPGAARKAGISVSRILTLVYVLSGSCAALGGLIELAQLSAVSPTYGEGAELNAIAAAVLGGTSLFGGRGKVFPNAVLGAILVQTVFNGLVLMNANPYSYPVFTSAIIFLAVLVDSQRVRWQGPARRLPWLAKEES